jgi:hypothetical protein
LLVLIAGIPVLIAGIVMLLLADANQPTYDCHAALSACERGGGLTVTPGRYSEASYELIHTLGFGGILLGCGLLLVGAIVLLQGRSRSGDRYV